MLKFRLDVYSWIPQPEVPNPIHGLPGGASRWGPGACGPFFGGDDFVNPPVSSAAWSNTYRAMQTFEFQATSFGSNPLITMNRGVKPGLTTVLTGKRGNGGTVCHSLTATVKTSTASVTWNASGKFYEARLHGAAQDPVPAAVAGLLAGGKAAAVGSALTPNLEWELAVCFQSGTTIPMLIRARYAISKAMSIDEVSSTFPSPTSFGGTSNLVHGLMTVRRFPSYMAYASIDPGTGVSTTVPLYFANANGRSLLEIGIGQTDVLRQLTW